MLRRIQILLLGFCCLTLLCAGCQGEQAQNSGEEDVLAYLESVAAQGRIDLDAMTEEQLERLLRAGPEGVAAELDTMMEELLSSLPTDPTLDPTLEFIRAWRLEKDGRNFGIDLAALTTEELDALQTAYRDGSEAQLRTAISTLLAEGRDILIREEFLVS